LTKLKVVDDVVPSTGRSWWSSSRRPERRRRESGRIYESTKTSSSGRTAGERGEEAALDVQLRVVISL